MSILTRLATALVAVCAFAAPATAAVVLDQSNLVPEAAYGGVPIYNPGPTGATSSEGAQTFTVGITGYLHHFDLLLGAFGNGSSTATLSVRNVTAGVPSSVNANSLTSVTIPMPLWTNGFNYHYASFDVSSANIFATAGQVFAITLAAQTMSPYGGWAQSGFYNGGAAFSRNGDASAWTSAYGDLPFASFMSDTPSAPAPTPEPAALGILGLGLAGLALRRRRA